MIITLSREGTCRECGSTVPAGAKARWYRNGAVYGLDCHQSAGRPGKPEPLGQRLSRRDRNGFYAPNGMLLGRRACGHEDYPCCGC